MRRLWVILILSLAGCAADAPAPPQLHSAVETYPRVSLTHEQIQLQYARYFLGKGAYPGYPYEWVPRADAHMVGLFASMWW